MFGPIKGSGTILLLLPVVVASCGDDGSSSTAAGGGMASGGSTLTSGGGQANPSGMGVGGTTGGTGGLLGHTGGAAQASGGRAATTGGTGSGPVSTGGAPASGGRSMTTGGTGSGPGTSGGAPASGGTLVSGGTAPITGGTGSGSTPTGGASQGTGETGGAAAGGAGGDPSGTGATGGQAATGGTVESGGSAHSVAGAGGTAGGGGEAPLACDTSWDTYPSKGDALVLTPPMGWNSWNVFHENINEGQIREIADAMVSSGMRDAGFVYINLDDKWMDDDGRDSMGNLAADDGRFPSGIADLADYMHERGLKLGLYGDRGTETCANRGTTRESGSYGHEEQDAQAFASWGVDYLKYDNCAIAPGRDSDQAQQEDYERMAEALRNSGRTIVFSICAWDAKPWMPNVGHLWRSTNDIGLCFSGCSEWYRNIDQIIDENNETADWAGPGHWNDPDMLEVGNGLPHNEDVAHFSLWAIMAAPLITGNDLRTMSDEVRAIYTNEEVIAVNQDPAGFQGTRVADDGDLEVWMKPLCHREGPEKAVLLLNRGANTATVSVDFSDIGLSSPASVRDLWAHEDLGEHTDTFSAEVPSHSVVMVKIVETSGS